MSISIELTYPGSSGLKLGVLGAMLSLKAPTNSEGAGGANCGPPPYSLCACGATVFISKVSQALYKDAPTWSYHHEELTTSIDGLVNEIEGLSLSYICCVLARESGERLLVVTICPSGVVVVVRPGVDQETAVRPTLGIWRVPVVFLKC